MTPTEKQKCIAEQSVYGDLLITKPGQETEMERRLSVTLERLPVLRPLSDLTKEITHRGYNNDEPFIPLVELAKTQYKDFEIDSIEVVDERSIMCKGYSKELSKRIMKENVKYNCAYWFHPLSSERSDEERDLLNLWHFDTRNLIAAGGAISTDTINPYKV